MDTWQPHRVLMNVRCWTAETLGVFWNALAPGGRHLTAPCGARGSLGLGAVCDCVNGLGLPTIAFSWLVFFSVYLGSTFGSAGWHQRHQRHLGWKPVTRALPSPCGS